VFSRSLGRKANAQGGQTEPAPPRDVLCNMKLTVFCVIVFVAGLWPGLAKYEGPVPEPKKHVLHTLKETPQSQPVLGNLADRLKLRL
jgi:hypothetical protein